MINEQQLTSDDQLIKNLAIQIGFDACGVSRADCLHESDSLLKQWLSNGYHGEMGYMERNLDKRLDPRELVPNAKTVISVLLNYYSGNPKISTIPPKISRYALGHDYHIVVKDMLFHLLDLIRKEFGKVEGRAFVDSAPVFERSWAERAGLGWIGKNGMLIHPKLGSFVFIGELIIDLEINPTPSKTQNRCGTCTRCIDACPAGAIVSPMVVDARKCISYLTIEKKEPLTEMEKKSLYGWCFGCDICQEVCPWNGKLSVSKIEGIKPKKEVVELESENIKSLSKERFDGIFSDSAISRAGWERLISASELI